MCQYDSDYRRFCFCFRVVVVVFSCVVGFVHQSPLTLLLFIVSIPAGSLSLDYVGVILGNDRLKIPPLLMNDGPQGFRCQLCGKTTTAFPCGLAIAATFDPDAAFAFGKGMGSEFAAKGANIQLGPGMNVARVPLNGRNFEYMSGEDPVLGARMVPRVIQGIQGQGVIANAKHWVHNNQETNRASVSANIDERT